VSAKTVTLKQVALAAGVSYQTVSKVLNGQKQVAPQTADRIARAVETLGYHASYTGRSLRTQRSFTIGYSWPPTPVGEENFILDQFLQNMFVAAEERGYYLLCFPFHADSPKHLATYEALIDSHRVDGFVLSNIEYDDQRVGLLLDRTFPFAAFGRSNPERVFPWIDVDGGLGIRLAMEHLFERGHRKVAALAWPEASRVGDNRMEGYFDVLAENGLEPEPAWIKRGRGSFDFGYRATLELLDLPVPNRPTALIALNDMMAMGALRAVAQRGLRAGHDFAVTGFDDAPMVEYATPPLTTVRQPIAAIGQRLISMLMTQIASEAMPEPLTELIAPQLMLRDSA
jgi:DNA-binding LacI/PurR family transcriptional regulator